MKDWKYGRLIDLTLLFCAGVVGGGLVTAVFMSIGRAL
tara:strand:+ start:310 stop:423 length:114 start_codon:yes stop_codon:yes gene_type:complete